jgi:hypothetical protein
MMKIRRMRNHVLLYVIYTYGYLLTQGQWWVVPKFHVALHASHAALPMVTLKISPSTNVTLTFDFDFGLEKTK